MTQYMIEGLERLGIWCLGQALRLRESRMRSGDLRYLHQDLRASLHLVETINSCSKRMGSTPSVVSGWKGDA